MEIGDMVPDILGMDAEGNMVRSTDFEGQPLVIYFYPKDNTPGCSAEACSLRDGFDELNRLGLKIIGISKDSPASHVRFAEKLQLPFMLLSDTEAETAKAFGVWQLKKLAGREYMGMVRTTFITDPSHRISHIIRKVDTKNAAAQILSLLHPEEPVQSL